MSGSWYHAPELLWTALAVVGGTARVFGTFITTQVPPKLGVILANAFVSGFSGFMVAQVVMKFDADWATIGAGVGGYLGTQGMDWIASLLQTRFGGQVPPPSTPTIPPKKEDDQ